MMSELMQDQRNTVLRCWCINVVHAVSVLRRKMLLMHYGKHQSALLPCWGHYQHSITYDVNGRRYPLLCYSRWLYCWKHIILKRLTFHTVLQVLGSGGAAVMYKVDTQHQSVVLLICFVEMRSFTVCKVGWWGRRWGGGGVMG